MSDDLLLQYRGPIAELVINRPRARNAITVAMWRTLPELIARADRDAAIRVLIVRGVDESAFAAGADIGEFESLFATAESAHAATESMNAALRCLAAFSKPVIAMIRGACTGSGLSIALACDLRFADPSARFAVPPVKLGLAYSIADTRRLVAAVGIAHAKDLLYSARLVPATEAHAMGLVDRMIPGEAIVDATHAYAMSLVANAPSAIAAQKRILERLAEGASDDDERARAEYLALFEGPDFREGYAAFLAKRSPRF